MFSRWPLRYKLGIGLLLLLVIISLLAASGFRGAYAYRGLARSVSRRATELPVATTLAKNVSELRITLSRVRQRHHYQNDIRFTIGGHSTDHEIWREDFRANLRAVEESLDRYRERLSGVDEGDLQIGDQEREWVTVHKLEASLDRVHDLDRDADWTFNHVKVESLHSELETLQRLAGELPSYLQQQMHDFAYEVRSQYRAWIVLTWVSSLLAVSMLGAYLWCNYSWIFSPLRKLIHGSRHIAEGNYEHRLQLKSQDEMSELARAMNAMTERFQEIRDDLHSQVRERTKEVVRSERLAGVGFLAAGVAHEINNPLASIALAADSLQERLADLMATDDELPDDAHNQEVSVARDYLRMIQDEAFRCKDITERLLDFSRMGDMEKQTVDLVEIVQGVIDMVGHLGRYRNKHIVFHGNQPVMAPVNAQEIKQVLLNLVTNGLDSLEPGGTVTVELHMAGERVELVVSDDGCGMTEEVQEHLFEPFFTRRRDGQGTGLGLSITYRIVSDHGGDIVATSAGPGCGSQFRVTLPTTAPQKAVRPSLQAA